MLLYIGAETSKFSDMSDMRELTETTVNELKK